MLFFKNKRKILVENAQNVARLAHKVVCYRKDILPQAVVSEIETLQQELLTICKDKEATNASIEAKMEALHNVIEKHGGDIYPVTFWSEHIEMLLVAAILAIGIRTFFFQPFKIPTNSMYPTYNGMTYEVFSEIEERPNWIAGLWRKFTLFTAKKQIIADSEGQSYIIVGPNWNPVYSEYEVITPLKRGNILPARIKDFYFILNNEVQVLSLPAEFGFEKMLLDEYRFRDLVIQARGQSFQTTNPNGIAIPFKYVKAGQSIIDFDIKTGDMLFVDRISYHFQYPKVGDPFVFRTENIRGLIDRDGNPDEKYYIKRLVGIGGDTLQIIQKALHRNGKLIEGADAFQANAEQAGEYEGYLADGWLRNSMQENIADGYFYAMGDNSDESHDSRTWIYDSKIFEKDSSRKKKSKQLAVNVEKKAGKPVNFVPEKEVVGKAIFIFYPFTKRWGPAQ